MNKSRLTLKIFLLIALNDVVDAIAQLFMKKGLVQTGMDSVTFANIAEFTARSASSWLVWLGIFVFALGFFIWIVVLYKIDLSIAMPVGSISYILVPLVAMVFLHERVGLVRWVGIFCIIVGIHFVSQSRKPAEEGLAHD